MSNDPNTDALTDSTNEPSGLSHLSSASILSSAAARPSRDNADGRWPRVVVYGAGAVGCYFGARLAQAGAPVTLIARPAHVAAIRRDGLLFESAGTQRHIAIDADSEPGALREGDIVLFCVKTRDTAEGARALAPLLRPGAIVVSLQNGVDNVPVMREAGVDALGAVVYVAASMPSPGHLLHGGRGDLVVGEFGCPPAPGKAAAIGGQASTGEHAPSARAATVAALFERAGVACRLEADVRSELWIKLVMNCAFNAISALGRSNYGRMLADADTRALMRALITECVAVAQADGVPIAGSEEQYGAAMRLGEAMAPANSSTAQDLARGRPTEIDSLNGYVARQGTKLGVATPVNQALATLVRLLERAPRVDATAEVPADFMNEEGRQQGVQDRDPFA
jgi:2-dehydropantoate 2-reductase